MDDEYGRLLEIAHRKGLAVQMQPSTERRGHARISLSRPRLQVAVSANVVPLDISASGISLLSDHKASPGTDISISVDQGYQIIATVVDCDMVESDVTLLEAKYRLHCTFADPDAGKLLAVSLIRDELAV